MSISKTRQMFVDVARQIFAKKGIANTTMNDIAEASGKGVAHYTRILKVKTMCIMPSLKASWNAYQTS